MNPTRPLVVGYDRSPASGQALAVAAELASELGARLHVVHVVDLRDYPLDPDQPYWERQGRAQLEAEFEDVKAALSSWSGEWSYDLHHGDPALALADVAHRHQARMIVLGTRGGSRLGLALERLLGANPSVSHALERADIPVLVVPSHAATHQPPADG
jgi:nucleotide-binding universal stress UspA family protein